MTMWTALVLQTDNAGYKGVHCQNSHS